MSHDPGAVPAGVPLVLLLDIADSLRCAGRIILELGDPAEPGATPESRRAQAAIDAVLDPVPFHDPAAPSERDRAATLDRAALTLNALQQRLAGFGGFPR